MNKLTKYGVSALCGSLAAVTSANAGDLSVTGGVDMSWMSFTDGQTGNPIGIGSNLTFSGSGELDNGITFDLSVANTNANAYSNTNVTITHPSLGAFRVSQGVSGSGIDRMDDLIPTAWEEAYGHGIGSGIQTVNGVSGSANIEWTPNADVMPDGVAVRLAYSPSADGSAGAEKTSSGAGSLKDSGWDATLTYTGVEGLTVFGGYSEYDQDTTNAQFSGDADMYTVGATYAIGQITVGYQFSRDNVKESQVGYYENDGYGITFNVNDDLTLSWGQYESTQDLTGGGTTDNTVKATSAQIAYSVGGASFRLAQGSVDNRNYSSADGDDKDGRTLSLSLAF